MKLGAFGHPVMLHVGLERRLEIEKGHVRIQFQNTRGINAKEVEQKRLLILVVPYNVQVINTFSQFVEIHLSLQ